MSFWEYANPVKFLKLSGNLLPYCSTLAAIMIVTGLGWGFFLTPDDYKQGATVKILYVHVPSAFVAINAWFMMLIASVIWLVRRHHVSALAAKAAAPIGIAMTVVGLVTGALWGQPMWGTWWEWDPKLTSFLILFLFYLGYIALWAAVEDPDTAADLTSVLCIVGTVFAALSRYAAVFWNQGLHQDASLSIDKEEHVADVFYYPLIAVMAGFVLLFIALVLLNTRSEIMKRRASAIMARTRI